MISIVTSVLNGEKYMKNLISSLHNNIGAPIQHILVDAGSTDQTLSIFNNIDHPYETKILHAPDTTLYEALNIGFEHASGDIYTYINSDDMLEPKILTQINNVFNTRHVDVLYGNTKIINENSEVIGANYGYKVKRLSDLYIIPFSQSSAYWSASAHTKLGGFKTQYKYASDYDFFYRLCSQFMTSHHYLDQFVSQFRMRPDALSKKHEDEMLFELASIRSDLSVKSSTLSKIKYNSKRIKNKFKAAVNAI